MRRLPKSCNSSQAKKVTFAATRTPFKPAKPVHDHQQQALRTNQKFLELKPLENDILASEQ